MARMTTLACLGTLAAAGALHAETAFDVVFRTGTLDGIGEGTEIHYEGEGPASANADQAWGRVVVEVGPAERARVVGREVEGDIPVRDFGIFDASVGNPLAMVFLEQTVQTISDATGGSPFYIRNRIRDALGEPAQIGTVTVDWDGAEVPATEVTIRPFENDAHRQELGSFADLEIRAVVSEAVPGWYHSIGAEAPAAGTGDAFETSLSLAELAQ